MAKAYIGADNAAKLVKAMYMGVDGVARKVTKAYRGVDGVAKLVYSEAPEGYLYGGTSTFVCTTGALRESYESYTLQTDAFVLTVTKSDITPLYVYFDGELVATSTTEGAHEITVDGGASTMLSRGTITVTVVCESTYSITTFGFKQYWYSGSSKTMSPTVFSDMKSMVLSNNITSIGDYAFSDLDDLTSVELSEGITSIGENAFSSCDNLTSIVIPNSVTELGSSCFRDCVRLSSVKLSESLGSIKNSTFYSCALTSIVIPKSVTSIGSSAFAYRTSLTNITFKHGVSDPLSIDINTSAPNNSAFYVNSELATNVYHNGNASVLDYDWATCQRTVTFIQE